MDSVKLLHSRWLNVAALLSFILAATFLGSYFLGPRKEIVVLALGVVSVLLGIFAIIKKMSFK